MPNDGGELCEAVNDALATIAAGGERAASADAVLNELAKRHQMYACGEQQDAHTFACRLREGMTAEGDVRGAREREVMISTSTVCRTCKAGSQNMTLSGGCDVGVVDTLEQGG